MPNQHRRPHQIWLSAGAPILVLVLIVTIGALALFWDVAKRQDRDFVDGSQALVASAIDGGTRALSNTTMDFAYWNDAYDATGVRWDADWLDANYFSSVSDGMVVFGGGQVRYAWFKELEGELAAVAADAAAQAATAEGLSDAGASTSQATLNSFASADGQLLGVSIAPISRELEPQRRRRGESLNFVASIDILSAEELSERGAALGLGDLGFTITAPPGTTLVSRPVRDAGGAVLGYLVWRNERPGSAGFAGQMWPIAIGLAFTGVMAIFIARRLVTRQIDAMAHAEAALESSRIKSEFIATMSHELRTPLNAIIGYSELIGEQVSPGDENEKDIRADAGRIASAAWHLLRMVNDILDHSRADAQTERTPVELVEVRHLLAEVEEVAAPQARARGNVMSMSAEADVYSVTAHPARLRQCLLNLVGNAIKFTKDGAVSVRARVLREGARTYVAFDVADTGIGISPTVLGRLFAPFVQGDVSIAREYGGAGLGLSISRKLARAMGGDVTVVSELGKGSTFTLLIPAASALRLVA